MQGSTTLSRFDQRIAEVSLRELARGVLTPTRPRPELEVDIELVTEDTLDDGFPHIEILGDQPMLVDPGELAATLRFVRADPSVSWFDKPEDVIALVGEPEPPAPHPLRVPLAIVGIAAVVVGSLIGIGLATGVLVL